MDSVYVIKSYDFPIGSGGQSYLCGIAATEEAAQRFLENTRKRDKKMDPTWSYDYRIEKWEVKQ